MIDTLIFDCVAQTSTILSKENITLQIDSKVRKAQKAFRDSFNTKETLIIDICDIISTLKGTKDTKAIAQDVKKRTEMIKKKIVVPDKPNSEW